MAAIASAPLPHADVLHAEIAALLAGFTIETTPGSAAKIADYREHLRPGAVVAVTFLPGSDAQDTIATAARLRREGFEPVPHLPARSIPGALELDDWLARLSGEAGTTRCLVLGGGVARPLGPFGSSMDLLQTGLLDRHGFRRVGVAGHPEGSPDIPDAALAEALAWKNAFAARSDAAFEIVTQFVFDAAPAIAWERRIRAAGNALPIRIGLPGLASLKTLIGHARACGIGPSMQVLLKQARNLARLMSVRAPDALVADLARHRLAEPETLIRGVHMYPLGGLRRSAAWSYAVADGAFALNADESGFELHRPID
jgi:methylenetetrahydrofolate reductase (NADPH)